MRATFALLVSAVILMPSSPVLAQAQPTGGSILWLTPPAGVIEPETEHNGALSASDFFGPSDVYIDVWELHGQAGESLTIDLRSDDFDAILFAVGPGLAETMADDDSGGRCNSRLVIRFLETGTYRVAATTTAARTTGIYTLIASTSPEPASAIACGGPDPAAFASLPVAGQITVGEPISGTLDAGDPVLEDGSRAEVWEITGQQGQTVTIRLESDAFDSYLYVTGGDLDGVITDDDSGGDLHAQIVFTFPAAGTYRITASSVSSGETGAYRLTVTR